MALDGMQGTGPGGRIVERDVEAALAGGRQAEAAPGPRPVVAPSGRRIEPGKMRQTTARRMAEAKRDIPHFYASSDVPMDECARLKEGLGELGGEYDGITYTHLVLKAVGLALRRVPEMNASLDGETIVLHETVHVGLATAVDDGLVVPVVRDCDRQPLGMLVSQVRSLVERARAGKFGAEDLRGGTFTVSNLGMYPVVALRGGGEPAAGGHPGGRRRARGAGGARRRGGAGSGHDRDALLRSPHRRRRRWPAASCASWCRSSALRSCWSRSRGRGGLG